MSFLGIPLDKPALLFILEWIAAGYVLLLVYSVFGTKPRPKPADFALDLLILSIINIVLFSSVLGGLRMIGAGSIAEAFRTSFGAALPWVPLLVFPALVGLGAGLISISGFRGAVARFLSIPNIHPDDLAFDHVFARFGSAIRVIITYEDGTMIYGEYAGKSVAASDPARSELYLERIFEPPQPGAEWTEPTPSRGALVKLAKVRMIEVIEP